MQPREYYQNPPEKGDFLIFESTRSHPDHENELRVALVTEDFVENSLMMLDFGDGHGPQSIHVRSVRRPREEENVGLDDLEGEPGARCPGWCCGRAPLPGTEAIKEKVRRGREARKAREAQKAREGQ